MLNTGLKKTNGKVIIGLNGSISSCVAAFLLKKQGFEVIARSVSIGNDQIGLDEITTFCDGAKIAFSVIEGGDEYFHDVVDPFISARLSGVKNNILFDTHSMIMNILKLEMERVGADFISSGHYAKVQKSTQGDTFFIHRGTELENDKSHLLSGLDDELLKHCLFPLGDLKKVDAYKISDRFHLSGAANPIHLEKELENSTEIKKTISQNVAPSLIEPGPVLNIKTESPIGNHNGVIFHEASLSNLDFDALNTRRDDKLEIVSFNVRESKVFLGSRDYLSAKSAYLVNLKLAKSVGRDKSLNCFFKIDTSSELFKGVLHFKSASSALVEFKDIAYPLPSGIRVTCYDREGRNAKLLGHGSLGLLGEFPPMDRAVDLRVPSEEGERAAFLRF